MCICIGKDYKRNFGIFWSNIDGEFECEVCDWSAPYPLCTTEPNSSSGTNEAWPLEIVKTVPIGDRPYWNWISSCMKHVQHWMLHVTQLLFSRPLLCKWNQPNLGTGCHPQNAAIWHVYIYIYIIYLHIHITDMDNPDPTRVFWTNWLHFNLTGNKHRNLSQNDSDPRLQHESMLVFACFGWTFWCMFDQSSHPCNV